MKKFELTNISIDFGSRKLYRIISLISIPYISLRKGDLGGYVESEKNLSQIGRCWIFDNAFVYNNGKIYDNALIYNDVRVYNDSECYENCIVTGNSLVCNDSRVFGKCTVNDNALIYNDASVYGDCELYGLAEVSNGRSFNHGTLSEKYITPEELERIAEWKKRKKLEEEYW